MMIKSGMIRAALVAAASMTLVLGSTMVASAEEYFAKPRLASNCNQVGCTGNHISVYNPASGVDIYVCVPTSFKGSADAYRTKAAEFYAKEAGSNGVAKAADSRVSAPSYSKAGVANVSVAPVDNQSLVAYFGTHKPNSSCNGMNCKSHVFVKDPSRNLDMLYCVPANWGASVSEYQEKLQEYMNLKAKGATSAAPAAQSAPQQSAAPAIDYAALAALLKANAAASANTAAAESDDFASEAAFALLQNAYNTVYKLQGDIVAASNAGTVSLSKEQKDLVNEAGDKLNFLAGAKREDFSDDEATSLVGQLTEYATKLMAIK